MKRRLYIECNMGVAGDMLFGALLGLVSAPDSFLEEFNKAGIPDVTAEVRNEKKCGISGNRMVIRIHGEEEGEEHSHHHSHEVTEHKHAHTGFQRIEKIIKGLAVSEKVKKDALEVYRILQQAESRVHGCSMEEIHFHEVGTMDAIADIVGVCMLMEKLQAEKVTASPICVGTGMVKCAHGMLPVPTPATLEILKGIPIYGGMMKGELCTPTGAALLKYFADEFESLPCMAVQNVGYGLGKKDFPTANCVRAMLGDERERVERKC